MHALRYSLRRLSREPGFVATALGVLALCLGANLLIYGVLHSLLLRPLPFAEPERLHVVYNSYPGAGLERSAASVRDYYTRRHGGLAAFESVSSYRYGSEAVGAQGQVRRLPVMRVTPEFFDTLGVRLARGTAFAEGDMDVGARKPVIVSHRYWQQALGGGEVLGRRITIGGESRQVVGVLPPRFRFLSSPADLFLPLVSTAEQRALNAQHGEQAEMVVRLRPGVDAQQALQQLQAHYEQYARGYPWAREVADAGFAMHVAPLQADHIAGVRPVILLLQAGALALLLVGAANLLNLLLLRHSAARVDAGIRWALGARKSQLLLPGLVEIALLCAAGGLLAWALARAGLALVQHWAAGRLPLGAELAMGGESIVMAAAASVALALLLGLVFAGLAARDVRSPAEAGASRGGSADRGTLRLRRGFAVAQMALAFVLLVGAGALGLGLVEAGRSNPGFEAGPVAVAAIDLPAARYPTAADRLRLADRAIEQLGVLPGVEAVGFSTNVPVRGRGSFNDRQAIHVPGWQPAPGQSPLLHNRYGVAGDYFGAVGIALLQGRYLGARDRAPDARNVVVDADFARFYWPGGRALGQRIFNGPDPESPERAYTVVGVVAAVRQEEVHAGSGNGTVYLPYSHLPHASAFVTVRSADSAETLVPALRSTLARLDPMLALDDVQPMQARIDATLVAHRAPALMSAVFAAAAVLLAAVGSFGLLGYLVSQGRREIGMRIALGAPRSRIARRYLGLGLRVFAAGAAIGLAGSTLLLHLFARHLPDVPSAGLAAVAASGVALGIVAALACLVPALRAARTSPMVVFAER